LEKIFSHYAQIDALSSDKKTFVKPKRKAFVFITTEPDSSKAAFEDLKQLDCISEVYLSHGVYDIVAKVTDESLDHLREGVLRKIKNLNNIKSVLTLTIV
jgi:DNA-binding Lrp family transcriptional regulator